MERLAGNTYAYNPGRWVATFLVAGVLLPWATGAVVWWLDGGAGVKHPLPGLLTFAAAWNYILAGLIPPASLMLVARTRNGPITWYRLRGDDRRLFAKAMFATFCILAVVLFALVWRANHGAIIPVMMTSFLPALIASLSGVLVGIAAVAGRAAVRRAGKAGPSSTSFTRRTPA